MAPYPISPFSQPRAIRFAGSNGCAFGSLAKNGYSTVKDLCRHTWSNVVSPWYGWRRAVNEHFASRRNTKGRIPKMKLGICF